MLSAFRQGRIQTLLATNVAARGLDIKDIYQVINYELPESSELFTHRIGRTGRMGKQGKAITLLAPAEVIKWRRMARSLGQDVVFQHLTLNENIMTTRPVAQPEVMEGVEMQERNPAREQHMGREQRQPARGQERRNSRYARPMYENNARPSTESRRTEHVSSDKPVRKSPRWTEEFLFVESEHTAKQREDGREVGRQPRVGRTTRNRNASTFTTTDSQRRSGRNGFRGEAPTSGPRRAASAKRFVSR